MFVRQKPNKSGTISIQIVDKSTGNFNVIRTVGRSKNQNVIEQLLLKADQAINEIQGQIKINFNHIEEKDFINTFFDGIEDIKLAGPELLLGRVFDEIGLTILKMKCLGTL